MTTSISSEWTFSQGGITISKSCSCLKGDIVEALQCLKCAIQHDLLFWEASPSSLLESQLDGEHVGEGEGVDESEMRWDELLIEEEDEDPMDVDTDVDD